MKARSLARHWLIQAGKRGSQLSDHLEGWLRAFVWLPRLARSCMCGEFSTNLAPNPSRDGRRMLLVDVPVCFINLDRRVDRRQAVTSELCAVGFQKVTRFAAISDANGSLGCARSHVEVLSALIGQKSSVFLVCEDDISFPRGANGLAELFNEFMEQPNLGVLCLANRVRGPKFRISGALALSNNIQTTACYLVKSWALEALRKSFAEGAARLEGGEDPTTASIDIVWKRLQMEQMYFAVPKKLVCEQRASFSDVAGRFKYYKR